MAFNKDPCGAIREWRRGPTSPLLLEQTTKRSSELLSFLKNSPGPSPKRYQRLLSEKIAATFNRNSSFEQAPRPHLDALINNLRTTVSSMPIEEILVKLV